MNRPSPHLIVFTLWLLVFSSASQTMIISPILPRIGEELGIADAALGTLVSAYSFMVGIFAILAGPFSPARQQHCARICIQDKFPRVAVPLRQEPRYSHDRIRIGYFSSDFGDHPVSHLIAQLIESHDR